jgi:hypothetical protein
MKAYRTAPLVTSSLALLALGCSSGGKTPTQSTGQPDTGTSPPACSAGGDGGGASTTPGGNANPEGVSYPSPTNGYGRNVRSGTTPGSVMENFVFLGYPSADRSQGLQKISLADYYDPYNKRYKLIHLSVASVWCVPCQQETDAFVQAKPQLDAKGVVVVQALDDGPTMGTGATQADLNRWILTHRTNFTELLDPGLQNLSGFFNAAAVPWNCDIDPRTMEILDSSTGWALDVNAELAPAFAALPATPSYPLPAQCN